MLLVVASRCDSGARALVDRHARRDLRLLTAEDLSAPGWRWSPDAPAAGTAHLGGAIVPLSAIRGAIVLLPAVTEEELPHIAVEERGYVAAEMTAFLASWLAAARFSVLNRPTPVCLMGPSLRPAEWLGLAIRAGLRVRPIVERVPAAAAPEPRAHAGDDPVSVHVIGARCFGAPHPALATQARRLATAAGAALLTVRFSGRAPDAELLGVYLAPHLWEPEIADALVEHFDAPPLTADARLA